MRLDDAEWTEGNRKFQEKMVLDVMDSHLLAKLLDEGQRARDFEKQVMATLDSFLEDEAKLQHIPLWIREIARQLRIAMGRVQ